MIGTVNMDIRDAERVLVDYLVRFTCECVSIIPVSMMYPLEVHKYILYKMVPENNM